ncbi:MAG: DUF4168 domain-containing protein [Gemmatimonadaceae bacterium]
MTRVSLAVLAALFLSLGSVTPAAAQAAPQRPDSALGEPQLTAYAKAFAAISAARDQAHANLALPRNKTDEMQRELREKLQKQIDQILKDQNLTHEQYARITYVISSDAAQRKSFEEIFARVAPKRDPKPGSR